MQRFTDLVFAFFILLPSLLLIGLCGIAILIFDGRPIFYISKRLGKNQLPFTIYKLRTMQNNSPLVPSSDNKISSYVTKLGHFLRITSLDELPQIINILNGTMSFVGPRPCLLSQSKLIKLRNTNQIFLIKPGITGLAQVRGRDKNSIKNKVRYDLFYLKKKSFLFDIKIILLTARNMIKYSEIKH
tara:strand:- start:1410 stop:1967 length:558 start_codon:yes stop_codon:yes gene_type:complete